MITIVKKKLTEESKFFGLNNYVVLNETLDENSLNTLNHYLLFKEDKKNFGNYFYVPKHRKLYYGDPLSDNILAVLTPIVEEITGYKLFPMYSLSSICRSGADLGKHKDSINNTISASITINAEPITEWPIFLENEDKEIKIDLKKGDMIIFKGNEIEHWRDKYTGTYQTQLFFFFTDANGAYAHQKYGGRPKLGIPRSSKQMFIELRKQLSNYAHFYLAKISKH